MFGQTIVMCDIEPLALTAPDGQILAWACPHCRKVRMSVDCGGADAREQEAEHAREAAIDCCHCRECGALLVDRTRFMFRCAPCEAAIAAKALAERPAMMAKAEAREAAQAATFALSPHQGVARALAEKMSAISEYYWCAGWMSGAEFSLWNMKPEKGEPMTMTATNNAGIVVERHLVLCDACLPWVAGLLEFFDGLDGARIEPTVPKDVPRG